MEDFRLFDQNIKVHKKDYKVLEEYMLTIQTLLKLEEIKHTYSLVNGRDLILTVYDKKGILTIRFAISLHLRFLLGIKYKGGQNVVGGLQDDKDFPIERPLKAFLLRICENKEICSNSVYI